MASVLHLFLLCTIFCTAFSDRVRHQDLGAAESTKCALPRFRPLTAKAETYCGKPLFGTLVVGCISATDAFGRGKACRVELATKKGRVLPGSQTFDSQISQGKALEWREAFVFHYVCPQMPSVLSDTYLNVSVMSKKGVLGLKSLLLTDVMDKYRQDDIVDTHDMQSPKGKSISGGRIHLLLKWCDQGDEACIDRAVRKAGAQRTQRADINCGQACHQDLEKKSLAPLENVENRLDNVEWSLGNLTAARAQKGKKAEERAKNYNSAAVKGWTQLWTAVRALRKHVKAALEQNCAPVFQRVLDALPLPETDAALWLKKPDEAGSERSVEIRSRLAESRDKLRGLVKCLEDRWSSHKLLTSSRTSNFGSKCHLYFATLTKI